MRLFARAEPSRESRLQKNYEDHPIIRSQYRISYVAMLAVCAIAVAVALGGRSSTARPYDSSTTKPYYSLSRAGSALPSGRECAETASGDTFEPVPQNEPENDFKLSASDLATYRSEASGGETQAKTPAYDNAEEPH